jgi:hypothetical protein
MHRDHSAQVPADRAPSSGHVLEVRRARHPLSRYEQLIQT